MGKLSQHANASTSLLTKIESRDRHGPTAFKAYCAIYIGVKPLVYH
jgi:hypothetical protein